MQTHAKLQSQVGSDLDTQWLSIYDQLNTLYINSSTYQTDVSFDQLKMIFSASKSPAEFASKLGLNTAQLVVLLGEKNFMELKTNKNHQEIFKSVLQCSNKEALLKEWNISAEYLESYLTSKYSIEEYNAALTLSGLSQAVRLFPPTQADKDLERFLARINKNKKEKISMSHLKACLNESRTAASFEQRLNRSLYYMFKDTGLKYVELKLKANFDEICRSIRNSTSRQNYLAQKNIDDITLDSYLSQHGTTFIHEFLLSKPIAAFLQTIKKFSLEHPRNGLQTMISTNFNSSCELIGNFLEKYFNIGLSQLIDCIIKMNPSTFEALCQRFPMRFEELNEIEKLNLRNQFHHSEPTVTASHRGP